MKRSQCRPCKIPPRTRRSFLKTSGLAGLLAGVPNGWAGAVTASIAPEVSRLNLGIIALTDCSTLVIAHEKGLFKKHGLETTISKGASWAAIRDSLANGDLHATHMLLGRPIASTMGLGGAPKKPMVAPFVINRNYMIFSDRNCNYPQVKHALWWLTQLRRWGFTDGPPDYAGVAKQVMRADLYEEAMKEIGHAHARPSDAPETLFDQVVFDPKGDLDAYATGFKIHTIKG